MADPTRRQQCPVCQRGFQRRSNHGRPPIHCSAFCGRYWHNIDARRRLAAYRRGERQTFRKVPTERSCGRCGGSFMGTMYRVYCSADCANPPRQPPRLRRARPYRKNSNGGRVGPRWNALRARVLAEEPTCWICGREIDMELRGPSRMSPSVDHIVPLHAGGELFDRANCRAAHFGCNASRGNRTRRLAA